MQVSSSSSACLAHPTRAATVAGLHSGQATRTRPPPSSSDASCCRRTRAGPPAVHFINEETVQMRNGGSLSGSEPRHELLRNTDRSICAQFQRPCMQGLTFEGHTAQRHSGSRPWTASPTRPWPHMRHNYMHPFLPAACCGPPWAAPSTAAGPAACLVPGRRYRWMDQSPCPRLQ